MTREQNQSPAEHTIPVVEEQLEVGKQRRETGRVRISKSQEEHLRHVDEPLLSEAVEVTRVRKDEVVTEPPSVRQEGDTTIIPVVEEELVIERRLILREEVHVRREQRETRYVDDVPVQSDTVTVERNQPERRD